MVAGQITSLGVTYPPKRRHETARRNIASHRFDYFHYLPQDTWAQVGEISQLSIQQRTNAH